MYYFRCFRCFRGSYGDEDEVDEEEDESGGVGKFRRWKKAHLSSLFEKRRFWNRGGVGPKKQPLPAITFPWFPLGKRQVGFRPIKKRSGEEDDVEYGPDKRLR